MTKYISKPENLKLMMNLLRDKSRNIQFEAFHVFKVNLKTSTHTHTQIYTNKAKEKAPLKQQPNKTHQEFVWLGKLLSWASNEV